MSATDVTDGNSEEIARGGGGSDEEAAWLDLIGRFDAPAGSPDTPVPWPDRENLGPLRPGGSTAWPGAADAGDRPDGDEAQPADEDRAAAGPGPRSPAGPGTTLPGGLGVPGGPGDDAPAGRGPDTGSPAAGDGEGAAGTPDPEIARRLGLPGRRSMDLPASPRSWTAPDNEEDEHFIPPPPPPLPALTPMAKGAWAALFGGPAYLLVATLAGWTVPGWALFMAVAAFVGGFIVLVLRLGGDGQDKDSDPGDGAVL